MTLVVLTEKGDQLKPFALANDSQAKKVSSSKWTAHSSILNEDLVLVCASGHLFSLDSPDVYDPKYKKWNIKDLPIMIDHFQYHISSSKNNRLFQQIKNEVQKADGVILATDPDQEGELIGRLILDKIPGGLKKLKYRLWNSSLTIGASKKAFNGLLDPKKNELLKISGESRQFADWLVGMNLTRMATIDLQNKGYSGVFSVGRVQTPLLTLIVANDQSIKDFKPQDYYQLEATTTIDGQKVQFLNSEKYFDQGKANDNLSGVVSGNLVRSNCLNVDKVQKKHVTTTAPKLFVLSDVQGLAAKKYGFSADKVMNLIESMYLQGFMSYTRPDSKYINVDEFNLLKGKLNEYQDLIDFHFNPVFLDPRSNFVKPAEKIDGHSALEPTEKLPKKSDLSDDEWKIYRLVVERVLLMFAPDFEYDETKIVAIDNNNNEYKKIGRVITAPGWRELTNSIPKENQLPNINKGDHFDASFGLLKKTTTIPKRITESSLIGKLLPKYNLGTQATRAGIIKELISSRKYIKINKNKELFPTNQGLIVYEFMKGTIYTKPLLTAEWDKDLVEISKGKKTESEFLTSIKNNINSILREYSERIPDISIPVPEKISINRQATNKDLICPKCKKGKLQLVFGKNKKKQEYKMYSCNRFPSCKFSIPGLFSGKTLSEEIVMQLIDNGITDPITFTNKRGSKYSAILKLENDKIVPEFVS
ncbi:type IA DNA topoisomerase [Fructilactobacillus cliffordii]|uniref:DNA topoisomerase n=1 Tax=Fructilactobacillus cliffordii TaxID=2940299 RepID=A0A9Q8ZYM9_9LACO|nr:type IA DNA topoisomerase [Fructilactobacillus cliffordii]USS89971.1 DNA topoisomerase [Fructilactobacillus cliffordii]